MSESGCSGLTKVFPGGAGVRDIHLSVDSGSVHALVGLNGAGKTTLMRLLLGMLRPDSGTAHLCGRPLNRLVSADWRRVGHTVGGPFAYPELDVRANLRLAARLHGIRPGRIRAVVDTALEELDLEQYAEKRVRVLSQGNLQRVGLAVALQHAPDVIVMDEPTSALDPSGVVLLREVLLRRVSGGAAILVSSHHLDEVARTADVITVVNGGEVVGELDPASPDIERAFFARVLAHDESSSP